MKCPKCHSDNPDTLKFCGECGTQLPTSEEVSLSLTKTLQTPVEDLIKGKTFAGRYKILEELGRGGMGVVYKAEDTKLKRSVALKFLPPELTHISEIKERFMREAQAAAALDHPNICTVHEFDEAEQKTFISMAYIEGQSLKKKIESGPLELDEALRIATQVAEGLREAHKKGVVHRDIKSANIMVDDKSQAKIMDFGLAKVSGASLITKEATTMGTVAYMSPEQAKGELTDQRTDIWSLGVVLYEMLTSKLPFKGQHEQTIIYSILNDDPEPVVQLRSEVPAELDAIFHKALAKSADKRYQNLEEMISNLQSVKRRLAGEKAPGPLTFLTDFLRRGAPLVVAVYVAAFWGIIQLVKWLVNRYILSPHLIDFSVAALLTLIPSVALLAFAFSKRKADKTAKVMRIGVPLNLLAVSFQLNSDHS